MPEKEQAQAQAATPAPRVNAANVSTGKPKAGGAVFFAPAGTALPTDATTALADAFVCVGFIDTDGVTITPTETSNDFSEWGGATVDTDKTDFKETTKFALIETKADNMRLIYGSDAVTGDDETGFAVLHKGGNVEEHVLVIDTLIKDSKVRRLVVPRAVFDTMDAVAYKKTDLVKYATTFKNLHSDAIGAASKEFVSPKAVA